jgi:hypothetical protein
MVILVPLLSVIVTVAPETAAAPAVVVYSVPAAVMLGLRLAP